MDDNKTQFGNLAFAVAAGLIFLVSLALLLLALLFFIASPYMFAMLFDGSARQHLIANGLFAAGVMVSPFILGGVAWASFKAGRTLDRGKMMLALGLFLPWLAFWGILLKYGSGAY